MGVGQLLLAVCALVFYIGKMDLTKGKGKRQQPMICSPAATTAFQQLKQALFTYPVLHTPLPDCPFVMYTDSSNAGLGAMLTQHTPQGERPIFPEAEAIPGGEVCGHSKGGFHHKVGYRNVSVLSMVEILSGGYGPHPFAMASSGERHCSLLDVVVFGAATILFHCLMF